MAEENIRMVMIKSSDFDRPISVLLYHPWLDGFKDYFTAHLSWLRENGFESIPLERLMEHLKGEEVLIPERPIVITFDDGTIENHTIAYPLLKKYGFIGTVFAPTTREYTKTSGAEWWGKVDREGILKIEGHSHTHALTFINDQIEDFYIGKRKDQEPVIKGLEERLGTPIFGLGYELVSQRFIPRKKLVDMCVNYVNGKGGGTFFEREDWKGELFRIVSNYKGDRGRYETEGEKRKRIEGELKLSKKSIEKTIGRGKEVKFFAYPFGAYDFDLIECLKNSGYTGAFTTSSGGNRKGEDPFLIKRMMILNQDSFGGLEKILTEYLQ